MTVGDIDVPDPVRAYSAFLAAQLEALDDLKHVTADADFRLAYEANLRLRCDMARRGLPESALDVFDRYVRSAESSLRALILRDPGPHYLRSYWDMT